MVSVHYSPELKCAACERRTGIDETLQFPCEHKHFVCEGCYDVVLKDGYSKCPKCGEHSFVSEKPFLPKPTRYLVLPSNQTDILSYYYCKTQYQEIS